MSEKNIVMLIDWENINLHCIKQRREKKVDLKAILQQARNWGNLRHTIAFSGFNDRHGKLVEALHWNSIEPRFTLTRQLKSDADKTIHNAADIHLAVTAMSMAHTQSEISGFVIVSGDSGFLPLMRELKLMGKRVFILSLNYRTTIKALAMEADAVAYYDELVDGDIIDSQSEEGTR